MGRLGFEPRTNRLKAEYSTVELATQANYALATLSQLLTIATPGRGLANQFDG